MIELLIYLLVFASMCIFAYLLTNDVLPFTLDYYQNWQAKRAIKFSDKLEVSFIFIEKKKHFFVALFPIIFAGAGLLLTRNLIGLAVGFILGLALPGLLIKIAWINRIKSFRGQLVDSIMIMSSCLKAGLSFVQAIEVLCEEMPPPISQEFGLVLKENKLGISLEESLRLLRKRIPLEEVNLLVSSILVAKETGGEFTKVLSRLTETIRGNIKLKEKIQTLTLQGRLQGIIMAILPVAFTWFIYKQNPTHFDVMFQTQIGKILIGVAIIAQICGMYLIKKISTIKI